MAAALQTSIGAGRPQCTNRRVGSTSHVAPIRAQRQMALVKAAASTEVRVRRSWPCTSHRQPLTAFPDIIHGNDALAHVLPADSRRRHGAAAGAA